MEDLEYLEDSENAEKPPKSDKLQVGIIGYGLAGRFFHAPLLKGTGFNIASIMAKEDARAAQAKADHPEADVVSNVDALLKNELDLVIVASVNHAHFENAANAIDAGIPIVVENPLGRDLVMVNKLIDYAVEKSVPITAYYPHRWDSEFLTTAKVIKSAKLGKIHRIESRLEHWLPAGRPDVWRTKADPEAGVGLLLDLQTHLISQALAWAGPAKVVYANLRHIRGGVDDDVTIVLKHLNGIESWLTTSALSGSTGPRIQVFGNKGTLVIDGRDQQEEMLLAGKVPVDGKWEESITTPAIIVRGDEAEDFTPEPGDYPAFYRACALALRGRGIWPISTREVLDVTEILDEVREFTSPKASDTVA